MDDFNEGWVPATYLEPLYGSQEEDAHAQVLSPGEGKRKMRRRRRRDMRESRGTSYKASLSFAAEEVYITINRYSAEHHDEITFEKGVLVEVFEKGLDGWWKIR